MTVASYKMGSPVSQNNDKEQVKVKNETLDRSQLDDEPISSPDEDKLDFKSKVSVVLKILNDKTLCANHAYSIGIAGGWGTGKTSFMNLVKYELQNRKDKVEWIVVDFNPRMSNSVSDIQADFLNIMRKALMSQRSLIVRFFTSCLFKKYIRTLLELNGRTNIAIRILDIFFKKTPEELRNAITKKIKITGKRIVVFIDDFDRLEKNEMNEVFKLISKNAAFPNTFFISGYDKEYVSSILNPNESLRNLLDGAQIHHSDFSATRPVSGRSYWLRLPLTDYIASFEEKYFNKEIRLFSSKVQMSQLFSRLLESYSDWSKHFGGKEINASTGSHIIKNLYSSRDVKRFINALLDVPDEVWEKVIPNELALVLLLKMKFFDDYLNLLHKRYFSDPNSKGTYQLDKSFSDKNGDQIDILKSLFSVNTSLQKPNTDEKSILQESKNIKYPSSFKNYFIGDIN